MVKLVYTEALKASSPQGECGFDSHSRYQQTAFDLPYQPLCTDASRAIFLSAHFDKLHAERETRGIRQRDLIPVFGASSVVSDVLNGKRGISKSHARKLADFFHAPVSLFI